MLKLFLLIILTAQISFAESKAPPASWELRTAPVAFLAKWITLDLSYFYKHFAIGPSIINYASTDTRGGMLAPTYNGVAYGLHAIFAESLYEDSFYVGAHTYVENYKSYPEAFLGYESRKGTKSNADVGYRWVRGNYSSMLGFGLESLSHSVESIADNGSTRNYNDSSLSIFHVEFKLGYLFK